MDSPQPARSADCLGCIESRRQLDIAQACIVVPEAQVKELMLQRSSPTSSLLLWANPLNAPQLPGRPPTGRKPGGQQGHRGHHRQRLPAERVNRIETHLPTICSGCQDTLPGEPGPHDPKPSWHQVAELPPMAALVTEHQAHARICPGCGQLNHATIPEEIRAHFIGPRLAAAMSFFAGRMRLSQRLVSEMAEEVFGLWMAATASVADFVIHHRRGPVGLQALLGEAIRGIIMSDRWNAYNALPLEQRQVCWAHLERDFRKCGDRGGEGKLVGDVGLAVVENLFTLWGEFRDGLIDRRALQRQLEPAIEELRVALERGTGCVDGKVRSFCDNLLVLYPALWLFAGLEGVEPTNNHAERMLRTGVLWRQNSFGNHSESGHRFTERTLTVVQTLRLQRRLVLDFLEQVIIASRSDKAAPASLML